MQPVLEYMNCKGRLTKNWRQPSIVSADHFDFMVFIFWWNYKKMVNSPQSWLQRLHFSEKSEEHGFVSMLRLLEISRYMEMKKF